METTYNHIAVLRIHHFTAILYYDTIIVSLCLTLQASTVCTVEFVPSIKYNLAACCYLASRAVIFFRGLGEEVIRVY